MSWVGDSPIHIMPKITMCCGISFFMNSHVKLSTVFLVFYCETIYLVNVMFVKLWTLLSQYASQVSTLSVGMSVFTQ